MTVLGNISPDSVISVCVVIAEKHLLYSISTDRSEQTNASKNWLNTLLSCHDYVKIF